MREVDSGKLAMLHCGWRILIVPPAEQVREGGGEGTDRGKGGGGREEKVRRREGEWMERGLRMIKEGGRGEGWKERRRGEGERKGGREGREGGIEGEGWRED